MHEIRNANECARASTRVICLVQPDSAPDYRSIWLLCSLSPSLPPFDRHVRWATPTLSSNFYAPNINNFVGFIVICAYFYVFTTADSPLTPARHLGMGKSAMAGKVLHIAPGNESEIVFRTLIYVCWPLLKWLLWPDCASLWGFSTRWWPGLAGGQRGNSLMVINLPHVMKFTIISASRGVALQHQLDFSINFEVIKTKGIKEWMKGGIWVNKECR